MPTDFSIDAGTFVDGVVSFTHDYMNLYMYFCISICIHNKTVMFLFIATTSMQKSTLLSNIFRNSHFGQNCQEQLVIRSLT